MFISKKSPFYWLSAIIIFYTAFKGCNEERAIKKEKEQLEAPEEKVVDINANEFMTSLNEIAGAIKKAESLATEIENFYSISYVNNPPKSKIGLCSNGYTFDISAFDENGAPLSDFKNINLSKFGHEKEFYKTLNEALTLSSVGQKIEIFFNSGNGLPKSVIGNKVFQEKEGALIMLTVKSITGKLNFSPANISSFLLEEGVKRRSKFKFFCKNDVNVIYSLYDTKGKVIKKDVFKTLTLGKGLKSSDFILEYLILTSKESKIDAVVPAKDFIEKGQISTLETIIIKGQISLKNV